MTPGDNFEDKRRFMSNEKSKTQTILQKRSNNYDSDDEIKIVDIIKSRQESEAVANEENIAVMDAQNATVKNLKIARQESMEINPKYANLGSRMLQEDDQLSKNGSVQKIRLNPKYSSLMGNKRAQV